MFCGEISFHNLHFCCLKTKMCSIIIHCQDTFLLCCINVCEYNFDLHTFIQGALTGLQNLIFRFSYRIVYWKQVTLANSFYIIRRLLVVMETLNHCLMIIVLNIKTGKAIPESMKQPLYSRFILH